MRRVALPLVYVLLVLLSAVPPEALSQDSQGARATTVPREEFFDSTPMTVISCEVGKRPSDISAFPDVIMTPASPTTCSI